MSTKLTRIILLLIWTALVLTRLYRLDYPTEHYFDEVYHAFTAQEMLAGNPAAWEWWNTPPQGKAYEWTHPPLSKLGMILGLKLVGNSSLGWRLPGAVLGIASGILLFAITQKLFSRYSVSLVALSLYTFDGLPLTMSRIGMNDIYLIFFLLLALFLHLGRKDLLGSIAFGLAIASKWSGIYFFPIYVYFLISHKRLYYLIVPPLVYLAAYLPFFFSGHNWKQFIELQRQMWWYHTGLKATHSYSSPALSWPIMYRPVWAFVEYMKNNTANIYLQGNPIIWWSGLVAVLYQTVLFLKKPQKQAPGWIPLLGYWTFIIPWTLSPRIMFIYHYLPSSVFMLVILAYTLARFNSKQQILFLSLVVVFFLLFAPRYYGFAIPNQYLNYLIWLPSWK